jgi:hypothetical protein
MQRHELDLLELLVGAGRDRARGQRAARLELREPVVVLQLLAGLEQPVVGEGLDDLLDHRPLDAEMRVAHRMGGLAASRFSAPMLMPPTKAISPSTTSSLRWLRRLRNGVRHGK